MRPAFLALAGALALSGCTSVDTAVVGPAELAGHGDAIAVIQGTSLGFTALFHIIDIVQSDLDTVVNKLLVSEAKAMGASRVELKYAVQMPRHGIFALAGGIIAFPPAVAMGVAVK